MAFHAPELLSHEERDQFEAWLQARWRAADAPETEWMTVEKSQRALDELRAEDGRDPALIAEIEAYIQQFECY